MRTSEKDLYNIIFSLNNRNETIREKIKEEESEEEKYTEEELLNIFDL